MKLPEDEVEYSWASSTALVDDDAHRYVGAVGELEAGQAEDGSVQGRHSCHGPAVGRLLEASVNVVLVASRAGDQGVSVGIQRQFLGSQQLCHFHSLGLGLVEQAQGSFPHLVAMRPANQGIRWAHNHAPEIGYARLM